MKQTRSSVEEYASSKGLRMVQIDGIPEGFSFIEEDIEIGGIHHQGKFIAFIPLSEGISIQESSEDSLLEKYNLMVK